MKQYESIDLQNSLVKLCDLQDFHAKMVIVADEVRRSEFEAKRKYAAFDAIADRLRFVDYNALVREYEHELFRAAQEFAI